MRYKSSITANSNFVWCLAKTSMTLKKTRFINNCSLHDWGELFCLVNWSLYKIFENTRIEDTVLIRENAGQAKSAFRSDFDCNWTRTQTEPFDAKYHVFSSSSFFFCYKECFRKNCRQNLWRISVFCLQFEYHKRQRRRQDLRKHLRWNELRNDSKRLSHVNHYYKALHFRCLQWSLPCL